MVQTPDIDILSDRKTTTDLAGKERGRLRLLVAIPALMILISLTSGIISYEMTRNLIQKTTNTNLQAELEDLANKMLLANFISMGVALLFGIGLAIYITKPIREITQQARKAMNGGTDFKVSVSSPDELGALGESFNSLMVHLNDLFKERNRYLLEGFVEGLITTGTGGEIMAVNTQGEKFLGLKAHELIGKDFRAALDSLDYQSDLNKSLEEVARTHFQQTIKQTKIINARGDEYNLSVTISPIKDNMGRWQGTIVTLRDLSLLASFAQQIQTADRLAAIGTFATGIAHELRNPLGSIKGVTQLMAERSSDEKIKEYASLIVGEVDRLDSLIKTLLNFSHPEPEPNIKADLNTLIDQAVDHAIHNPSIKNIVSQITLVKDYETNLPPCRLQKNRICQALSNIILNAFQNSSPEEGHVKIKTLSRSSQNDLTEVEVHIVNNGEEIPKENMERIFEPFFTTNSEGTGLGLPIAYQIIISNGGNLDVESRKGKTNFILRFPFASNENDTILSEKGM